MADDTKAADDGSPKGSGMKKALIWATLGFLVGASGFAVPLLVPQLFGNTSKAEDAQEPPPEAITPAFIEFGETVVNLKVDKFNRYLRIDVTLQVAQEDVEEIQKQIELKQAILKSWMLSHLSDKDMEEIRGAAGQNQLRREIQDKFNEILFPDGFDRIRDVLFLEFNVQ